MRRFFRIATLFAVLPLVFGCDAPDEATVLDSTPSDVIWTLPLSTESDAAREHFIAGLHGFDMMRFGDANRHFEQAIESDSSFALAYLYAATSGASTDEYTSNLARSVELLDNASPAEQMLIMMEQNEFVNNVEGQLSLGLQLVEANPRSPRAWLALGNVQTASNRAEESRESFTRAVTLAPDMSAAYMLFGNNYLFLEPRGLFQAQEHFRTAIELEPDEPNPYDLLGDAYRAHGNLEDAYEAYSEAARRAPEDGLPLQQRAHVNSILGNFDEAREDYTRAMELEEARGNNLAPFFAVYRAYIPLHEGNPEVAISELQSIASDARDLELEGTDDIQINALTSLAWVAMHSGSFDIARNALDERALLMRAQSGLSGVEEFVRAQEASITYAYGVLEAMMGNNDKAAEHAAEFARLVEPDPDPRKMERMHEILGFNDYAQGNFASAAEHFESADPGNIYPKYYRALALEKSGSQDSADSLLAEIARWNFNDVGFAMVRNDVMHRTSNL